MMVAALAARLDGWLHAQKLRRLRLMRRLGLLPKPTPESGVTVLFRAIATHDGKWTIIEQPEAGTIIEGWTEDAG